ncbi:MAG TPA: alpha/beta fold hydrolase [Propionibacterium sp.]|jgi:2-hydroxy-6-oxonona-2,4-dienedioate hydrolase/4,5:9,10-diseco-3-hydroxy-5,9,17-trioxoandrosta-1(10),2-diene-4-oate hydrolase|nr:alpha/beta fold hydrolase [Propionibacterium sp.]
MTELTAESTARTAEIAGSVLKYHEAGEGPLLLCIHGGAPGAYGWGNFGIVVAELAKDFRTVVVDLPGYGGSDPIDISGGRYAAYANTFVGLIAHLGEAKAHILGMATGGAVGIAVASSHPESVERLVLVSSAGGLPMFTVMPSEGQKHIRDYYKGEGPSRERMRAYLEMMLADPSLITDEMIEERYLASLGRESEIPVGGKVKPEELWRDLNRIAAPTLVMWGRDNRIQGYDNALFMLKQIPDVEVHLFGRTGLWIPFERPKGFCREVRGFLLEDREP